MLLKKKYHLTLCPSMLKYSELHYELTFIFIKLCLSTPTRDFICYAFSNLGDKFGELAFKIFSANKILGKGTFNCVKEQMTQLRFTVIITKWWKWTTSYKDGALKTKHYLSIHSPPHRPFLSSPSKGNLLLISI